MRFCLVLGAITIKWTTPSAHGHADESDERTNASMILEYSNACPFKYYKNIFGCVYCRFKSADFAPIKSHSKEHKFSPVCKIKRISMYKADVTDLRCELCQQPMTGIPALIEHLIDTHNKPLNKKFKTGIVPYLLNDGYACADCGLAFDYFHNLNIHVNEHNHNYICPECGKSCSSQERLNYHVFTHNKTVKTYNCSKCNAVFATQHKRKNHMTLEHNIFPYKCPYCTETFKRFKDRVAHLNELHGKNINYPCKFCTKIFSSSTNRSIHTRDIHTKDKPVSCGVCGHIFQRRCILKRHMRTHKVK